jgi:hypothetical protein
LTFFTRACGTNVSLGQISGSTAPVYRTDAGSACMMATIRSQSVARKRVRLEQQTKSAKKKTLLPEKQQYQVNLPLDVPFFFIFSL